MDTTGERLPPDWLELIDHTADAGFVVRATTLPELFERSAWGMFSIITEPGSVQPKTAERITLDAPDLPALLVRWLGELNFRHVTRHFLFSEFLIHDVNEQRLTAEARGEPIDPARHTVHTEIKAVTFHGLQIQQTGSVWRAQVIFDL